MVYLDMSLKRYTMVKLESLEFYYKKSVPLFENFSLNLESGKIVGLLGKNGTGKSTLLSLISELLFPKSGKLSVNGFNPADRDPNFLADIYFVPEEFVLPNVSIATYVKAFMPLYPAFDELKLKTIFKEFELTEKDKLNSLSHGQRKKFLIALALASNCRLLILDEPTNGLDIPSKSLFRKMLVSSITDEQLVLISTHQVKDIDTIIDEVLVLDNGKTVFHESLENVTKKYSFELSADKKENALYAEKCPFGYRIITESSKQNESVVDLELLFNAIINHSIK